MRSKRSMMTDGAFRGGGILGDDEDVCCFRSRGAAKTGVGPLP